MDNLKPNLLLIYNKGNLAKFTKTKLKESFKVQTLLVKKEYSLDFLKDLFLNCIKKKTINICVYISGETRAESFMYKLNFEYPFFIAGICEENKISLIYLSSLSVYGIPNTRIINNLSKKNPYNKYGKSKNKFDSLISSNFPKLRFCSIVPGSIINPYSKKNNIIDKSIINFSSRPLNFIFNLISPAGNFACVHIDDLTKAILIESENIYNLSQENNYMIFKNCTRKIKIYDLISLVNKNKPFIKIFSFPLRLLELILIFTSKTFISKLIVYFTDIEYINDYDYLDKRPITDYLKKNKIDSNKY